MCARCCRRPMTRRLASSGAIAGEGIKSRSPETPSLDFPRWGQESYQVLLHTFPNCCTTCCTFSFKFWPFEGSRRGRFPGRWESRPNSGQLADFFLQRHLAEQSVHATLDRGIVELRGTGRERSPRLRRRPGSQGKRQERTFQPPTKTPRTMPPGRRTRSECPPRIHSIL